MNQTTPSLPLGDVPVAAEHFEAFWKIYPRRTAKPDAERAFGRAMAKRKVPAAVILEGARRYANEVAEAGTELRYVAHPATWLNAGRWGDEPGHSAPASSGGRGAPRPIDTDRDGPSGAVEL